MADSSSTAVLNKSADTASLDHSNKALLDDGSDHITTSVFPAISSQVEEHVSYRLYKRRYLGLVALVVLSFASGLSTPWFGPIATNMTEDFGFSLDQVNWLGISINVIFLPSSVIVPTMFSRFGVRTTCYIAAGFLLIASWARYAGTARSLSENGAYGLIMLGQLLSGIAAPAFQVIGPLFSETWFDLKNRTTVTMLISVANPVGGAIAQVISPSIPSTRTSILVLAIIASAATPLVLLISDAPPTPPTHSASVKNLPFMSLIRAMAGLDAPDSPSYMTIRERLDFVIITLIFGVLFAVVTTFTILTNQIMGPYGYSNDTAGLMGATLLLAGLITAAVTSPVFDRVLTRHLAITCKFICPILGGLWLSLIWTIRPDDLGGLFVTFAIIGACSLTILPVGLELAVEVTHNAGSAAILWFAGNLMSVVFTLVEGALRAGPDAKPPLNMHRALVFQGVFVCASVVWVVALQGKQKRRELDERLMRGEEEGFDTDPSTSPEFSTLITGTSTTTSGDTGLHVRR